MFSIFKRKTSGKVDLSGLQADMHSHLLPGIDDGAPDIDMSLKLLKGLEELGYRKLVTTPHILWDVYKNDAHTISNAYHLLEPSLPKEPSLAVAAEYLLDDHFDQLLETNTPLLTIRDNWVLVEFSFVSAPMNFKEKIFALQIKGYQPILAHPERYLYFSSDRKIYDKLKDAGCYFQVNLLSLAGYYGKQPQELANYFIKKQQADFLGTDMHHLRHLHVLQSSPQIMNPVHAFLDSGKMLNNRI